MNSFKWVAAMFPYVPVYTGLFFFHNAWIAMLGFQAAILLMILIGRPGIPMRTLFKTTRLKWMFPGILLCSSGGILIYYVYPLLGSTEALRTQLATLGLGPGTWLPFIAYFSLVNPPLEEYFWRAQLGSDTRGFYMGDVLYAGYHGLVLVGRAPWLIMALALISLTLVGWIWRQVGRAEEGLLVPVVSHMAADFSVMMGLYLLTVS